MLKNIKRISQKFIKKNWQAVSMASLVSKAIAFAAVFALMPLIVNAKTYDTKIALDQNNPFVLDVPGNDINIAAGVSNLDAQKIAKSHGQIASIAYGRAIERDGSYFQNIYKAAGAKYGIPWQLLQAVHYVESGCSDSGYKTSSAGAQGPMQFMPGTFRHYAVDGNGDGTTDINNVSDAIYAAANLLASSGAADGNIDGALLNYNHSMSYVYKVKEVMSSVQ